MKALDDVIKIDIKWLKKHRRFYGDSLRHKGSARYYYLYYSIMVYGLLKPIELLVKDNIPRIVNGNHRLEILEKLNCKKADVHIYCEDDLGECGKCGMKTKNKICPRCSPRIDIPYWEK